MILLLIVQILNQVDRKDLWIVIDEWKRTYEGGKYMGLLLRGKPDKQGKVRDWLISLNDSFENGSAENMRQWIKRELEYVGLHIEDVTLLVADNEQTNKKLAADMGVEFEGCSVHLVDLVGDDAWACLEGSWTGKLANLIGYYFSSSTASDGLEFRQKSAGLPVKGLLKYNLTRWVGKALAMERFIEVCKDPPSRGIIGYNFTESEEKAMNDVMPFMNIMGSLIASLSREKNIFGFMAYCNYGSHYRLLQQAYILCTVQCVTLDWDSRDPTELARTWFFGKKLLEGFETRFFANIRPEVVVGLALEKGEIENFGFNSFPELEDLLLHQGRNSDNLNPSEELLQYLSAANCKRVFTQAPALMEDDTPITTANIISHLKYKFKSVHDRWKNEIYSEDSVLSALQSYHQAHSLPMTDTTPSSSSSSSGDSTPNPLGLLRGRSSPMKQADLSQLRTEWTLFKNSPLPFRFKNTLGYSCHPDTTAFPILRQIINKIHSRPFHSVPVEQVFSVGRAQTTAYSASLNVDDYETRVVIAYNRRNYTFEERCRLYGITPYVFKYTESRVVKNAYSEAMDMKLGAHNRRDTGPAREQKRLNAAELKRSVSAPPGPNTVLFEPSRAQSAKRPGNRVNTINTATTDELEILSEFHNLNRSLQERAASRDAQKSEELKSRFLKHITKVLEDSAGNEIILQIEFADVVSRTYPLVPGVLTLAEKVSNMDSEYVL